MPPDTIPSPLNDDAFRLARQRCDAYNRQDPNQDACNGVMQPREWLHAQYLETWVLRLSPQAGHALRLAARCQHIGRWEVPRNAFPLDRTGYLRWRNTLKEHHATITARILQDAGYGTPMIDAVQRIVRKQGIKHDPDVQCMENALCLVFLEHQLEAFCDRYPDKVVDVLQKTWRKMDEAGRQAALTLPLSARGQRYLREALAAATPPQSPSTE